MQHQRGLAGIILGHVFRTQPFGQVGIELYRAALPQTPQAVLQREFDFRPVKRALSGQILKRQLVLIECRSQRCFRLVPVRIRSDPLFRAGGQLDLHVVKAEVGIHRLQHHDKVRYLSLHLIFGTENVRVVLGKAAHPHQTVQRTGRLIAVA